MSLVVHCKKSPYDVYIGRPGPWGNPFVMGQHGTRKQVIAAYRLWLKDKIAEPTFVKELMALEGKVLGCWCSPEPCHGNIMVETIAWLKTHSCSHCGSLRDIQACGQNDYLCAGCLSICMD